MNSGRTVVLPYYLGCPVWSCPKWVGSVYGQKSKRADWLADYTRTFNTVEGNSTFYALPKAEVAERWANEAAQGFKFAFKFPQTISHAPDLRFASEDLRGFLAFLEIFARHDVLGDTFLQLPPHLSAKAWPALYRLLKELPANWGFAVEPRHPDWFDQSNGEQQLDGALRECGFSRVLFDSRPLFSQPPSDEAELVSQSRKPRSPFRQTVTNSKPMLRLVGRNHVASVDSYLEDWAFTISEWLQKGFQPFVFTHTPDDAFAPAMAMLLHQKIRRLIPTLPEFGWSNQAAEQAVAGKLQQLNLF
jgi:uncharacterized protein YecE (DUF72 family)